MISASQVNFGLEELAGIAPGVKGKGQYNEKCMIEKLMNAYYDDDESYKDIEYNEQDIADLVEYTGLRGFNWNESKEPGRYTGQLITNLTKKNKKLGKKTIIEIPENRLDFLGYKCEKFDVVKIGVNYGNDVFEKAKQGKLLYVERCEGGGFAGLAGEDEGDIGAIVGVNVIGEGFAGMAGGGGGHVGAIVGKNVSKKDFAEDVGCVSGNVGIVVGVNVGTDSNTEYFSVCLEQDKGTCKILQNSREADIEYNRIIDDLNKEYNLGLKKVKVRKLVKRCVS